MNLRRVSDGSRVRLGLELGRGGEGAVFPVVGDDARVAKIYFKAPSAAKVEKLRAMTRSGSPALLRVAAWPVELLEDESHRVRGFLMPRVAAREDAHQLYSPRSRRRAFPDADFRFLVRAAANVARAFAQVHEAGHVIGDVNHGNALIGKDATVVLIDCDSFQVRDGSRIFTCDVGVPLFTAPELQNMGFRGLKRSRRHDAFGLAVLVFHLLFQGRHPFAGQYAGGEMPIERAIAELRFAYGMSTQSLGMRPPPATLPLGAFGPEITFLFERAFAPTGEAVRPAAREWVEALVALERELDECAVAPLHFHIRGAPCCWCELEKKSGVRLFGGGSVSMLSRAALNSLWSAIKAVRKPPSDPLYPLQPARPRIPKVPHWAAKSTRQQWMQWPAFVVGAGLLLWLPMISKDLFGAAALLGLAGYLAWKGWKSLRKRAVRAFRLLYRGDLMQAEQHWKKVAKEWNERCSSALFNREVERLEAAQRELASWDKKRSNEIRWLRREHETRARELHLSQFVIDPSHSGLNPTDVAALVSFGFETAADVIRRMSELTKVLAQTKAMGLMAWARGLDARFDFDGKAPPDARLVAEVDQRLADRQRELLATLRAGPDLLERKRQEIEYARAEMASTMETAARELRAARAAANAVSE